MIAVHLPVKFPKCNHRNTYLWDVTFKENQILKNSMYSKLISLKIFSSEKSLDNKIGSRVYRILHNNHTIYLFSLLFSSFF